MSVQACRTGIASTSKLVNRALHTSNVRRLPPYSFGRDPSEDAYNDNLAPYNIHAHCTRHNTILSLTRGRSQPAHSVREAFDTLRAGHSVSSGDVNNDDKLAGSTVVRLSCGTLGFKKAQRATFEAATQTALRMFERIENVGKQDRKTKENKKTGGSRVVRDPEPNHFNLIFNGYGPGREALVAALQTEAGTQVRQRIKNVVDATPIKIGGVRPKKRRKIAPPLAFLRKVHLK